jgi:hypothetical protein
LEGWREKRKFAKSGVWVDYMEMDGESSELGIWDSKVVCYVYIKLTRERILGEVLHDFVVTARRKATADKANPFSI